MADSSNHDAPDPRLLRIDEKDWRQIVTYLSKNPAPLFFDQKIRTFVAQRRAAQFAAGNRWAGAKGRLISYAIDYNEGQMNRFLESHVVRLIRPLSILDPIYENANTAKVLSIGPRNENELFHLCAYGFDINKIEAIDLVSNSPLVKVMDMHDLEYPNNSFDVVISGWTLPYSRDPRRALAEKMRVLRPGGLLCIGLTRVPPATEDEDRLHSEGATNYLSAEEILRDIGDGVGRVEFVHDPLDPTRKGAILLIVRAAG